MQKILSPAGLTRGSETALASDARVKPAHDKFLNSKTSKPKSAGGVDIGYFG
jgi:hypothetical protein